MKIRRNLFFSAAAIALALCLAGGAVNITAAPQQQQGTRNLVVTVQVSTPDGQHLNGARVNIYVGYTGIATLGTDSRVRPPDFQDLTNPQGIVQFKGIPVKPGADLGITFEISRDDIETIRQDVDFGTSFPDRLPPQKFKLVPKGAHASINMRFKVMDGDDEPVPQANVRVFMYGELKREWSGTTGSDGAVSIDVGYQPTLLDSIRSSLGTYTQGINDGYNVAALKVGYTDSGVRKITLRAADVGNSIDGGTLKLTKKSGFTGTLSVQVHVTDGEKHTAIPDAVVQLNRISFYSETTNSDGMVTIPLTEEGTFNIKISQQFYETVSNSVLISSDSPPTQPLEYSLKLKETKTPDPDTINVTVLFQDPSNTGAAPQPLPGASVSDGHITVTADADGHATLSSPYDVSQDVTVSASGYKTQTKSVRINKTIRYAAGSGNASFTLQPDLSENSPLTLHIEVKDTAGNAIPRATLSISTLNGQPAGKTNTNDYGIAEFSSFSGGAAPADMRHGLTLNVNADGYKPIVNQSISSDLLKPSLQESKYSVQMDLSDNSPLHLYVQAQNASGYGVSRATVTFKSAGGRSFQDGRTNDYGLAEFEIGNGADAAEARRGLFVDIRADGYKPVNAAPVPADLLKPATTDTAPFTVRMARDWSELTKAIGELEARVKSWRNDYDALHSTSDPAASQLIDQILQEASEAQQIRDDLTTAEYVFRNSGIYLMPMGSYVKQIQQDIQDIANQIDNKQTDLNLALKDATSDAEQCMTAEDANTVRTNYQQATQLLVEIANLKKQAGEDAQELARLTILHAPLEPSNINDKAAHLGNINEAADEAAATLKQHYDHLKASQSGLDSTQTVLKGQLADLNARFISDTEGVAQGESAGELQGLQQRLTNMAGTLNPSDSSSANAAPTMPSSVTESLTTIAIAKTAVQAMQDSPDNTGLDQDMSPTLAKVDEALNDSSLSVGLSSDLLQQADACAKSAAAAAIPADPPKVDALPEDNPAPASSAPAAASAPAAPATSSSGLPAPCEPKAVLDQVNALINKAANIPPSPEADGYVAQANALAAPYPCIAARVASFEGAYINIKAGAKTPAGAGLVPGPPAGPPSVEAIPEDSNFPQGRNNPPPKVEGIPEDSPSVVPNYPIPGVALGGTVGTVVPPTLESIPEDGSRPAQAPAPASQPRDPNQPSGWEKVGNAIGGILNGLNSAGNNGGGGNRQPAPSAGSNGSGGANRSGGNRSNPTPQGGGGNASAKPPAIDLSGTWEVENIAGSDAPCKVWVRMTIQAAGEGTWTGPETVGNNCKADPNDMAGQLIVKMFQGMQGTVTVVTTFEGKLRWSIKMNTGGTNAAAGTYDKSEIDLSIYGQTVKFMKK